MIKFTMTKIKSKGYWCENATVDSEAMLEKLGLRETDPIEAYHAINMLGLADFCMCLNGAVKADENAATRLLKGYAEYLHGLTWAQLGGWLEPHANDNSRCTHGRSHTQVGKKLTKHYLEVSGSMPELSPVKRQFLKSNIFLFSSWPLCVRTSQSTKRVLTGYHLLNKNIYDDLKGYLQWELKKT